MTFEARFPETERIEGEALRLAWSPGEPAATLLVQFAGATFSGGLYRIHTAESAAAIEPSLAVAFPDFVPPYRPFGFDWLGRQFVCRGNTDRDAGPVLMLEPGTGEALEIPTTVWGFHDQELTAEPGAALAATFFDLWLRGDGRSLTHDEAVAYKVPLFLGGEDTLSNLELSDNAVYWAISAQLIQQARGLSAGTEIRSVELG
jgi:Domain of unknown function (DUF1851)